MTHSIHRCQESGICNWRLLLGCLSTLWALSAAMAFAEDGKAAYQRFAVIGSQAVQKSGLSDLVAAELLQAGVELVEREQLNAVVTEQILATALGNDAPEARIRLGAVTKADALVLVSEQPDPQRPCVQVVVTECLQGARLSSDFFPISTPAPQLAHQIAEAVARTRVRFSTGVKTLIGVPPFLSRNFTYEHHSLQTGYSTLLQESLAKVPGVAVVEVEEAQAIRREQIVTGGKTVGVAPIFVEGEYEVVTEAGKPPGVNFDITIRTERDPQVIHREGMALADALQFVADELPRKVLAEDRVDVNSQPFAPDKEFTRLVARADAFVSLGEWEHAARIRLAALVIKPDDPKVRNDVADECILVVNQEFFSVGAAEESKRDQVIARLFPFWVAAMESMEWEIHHHPNDHIFVRASTYLNSGLHMARGSSSANAAQDLKREFLLRVFPLTFQREWDDPAYRPPRNVINPFGPWSYNDDLVNLALIGANLELGKRDYDLLLTLLNGEIREKIEPSARLTSLLWGQDPVHRLLRGRGEAFPAFLRRLATSPRRVNQILARVAMASWNVDHGRPVDADMLNQVESLRAEYATLVLVPIPSKHLTVIDELNRLHDLGPGMAATRPAVVAALPDLIEQGALRLEKLQLRRISTGHPGVVLHGSFKVVNGDASFDILWNVLSVNLMRDPDFLEEIAAASTRIGDVDLKFAKNDFNRRFTDVKWDGERIWIATAQQNVWALDAQGKVVAQVGPEQGMPPTTQGVLMQPLGPGRVIVVGNTGAENRAFIGLIEQDKDNQAYRFKIIHKATRVIEPKPGVSRRIVNDVDLAFRPDQVGLARAVDGTTRFVVIRRRAFPVGNVLLVNASTLEVSAPDSPIQWEQTTLCGNYILQPTRARGIAFWQVSSAGEFAPDAKIPISSLRFGAWHFTTAPTESSPVFIIGKQWFFVDPIAKTGYRLAPQGSFGGALVYDVGWTRAGPIVWFEGADHLPCAYKVIVSTDKLGSLPPGDVFRAEPVPATMPATMPATRPISPSPAIR